MNKNKAIDISILWKLIYVAIGISIGVMITVIAKTQTIEIILLPFIVSISALIAILSFNQHKKINEKNVAQTKEHNAFLEINNHIKSLETYRAKLDKLTIENEIIKDSNGDKISFTERLLKQTPLEPDEIHDWVCDTKKNDYSLCKMTLNGSSVITLMMSIINTYEIMSSAIDRGILDRDMSLELMERNIVNNFSIYKKYIYHQREEHNAKELGSIWERLHNEIKKHNKVG